jgi:hypothetical protein
MKKYFIQPPPGGVPFTQFVREQADFNAKPAQEVTRLLQVALEAGYKVSQQQVHSAYGNAKQYLPRNANQPVANRPVPRPLVESWSSISRHVELTHRTVKELREAILKAREIGSRLIWCLEEMEEDRLPAFEQLLQENATLRQRVRELE